ncbi:MAG: hypothetical protein M1819_000811 [Sarea resinae]|nr:MAG: hypothetical protein M1819_000811 [Sarea resinae]
MAPEDIRIYNVLQKKTDNTIVKAAVDNQNQATKHHQQNHALNQKCLPKEAPSSRHLLTKPFWLKYWLIGVARLKQKISTKVLDDVRDISGEEHWAQSRTEYLPDENAVSISGEEYEQLDNPQKNTKGVAKEQKQPSQPELNEEVKEPLPSESAARQNPKSNSCVAKDEKLADQKHSIAKEQSKDPEEKDKQAADNKYGIRPSQRDIIQADKGEKQQGPVQSELCKEQNDLIQPELHPDQKELTKPDRGEQQRGPVKPDPDKGQKDPVQPGRYEKQPLDGPVQPGLHEEHGQQAFTDKYRTKGEAKINRIIPVEDYTRFGERLQALRLRNKNLDLSLPEDFTQLREEVRTFNKSRGLPMCWDVPKSAVKVPEYEESEEYEEGHTDGEDDEEKGDGIDEYVASIPDTIDLHNGQFNLLVEWKDQRLGKTWVTSDDMTNLEQIMKGLTLEYRKRSQHIT